jgi:hypothetical protein
MRKKDRSLYMPFFACWLEPWETGSCDSSNEGMLKGTSRGKSGSGSRVDLFKLKNRSKIWLEAMIFPSSTTTAVSLNPFVKNLLISAEMKTCRRRQIFSQSFTCEQCA